MANVRFELDCPKCQTEIVIRSSAQIGKKVECPKCKYRFVVPELEDDDADDAPAASAGKGKKGKKGKKGEAAKAGGGKVMIGALLGVLALAGLGVGAYLLFFSGDGGSAVQGPPAKPGPANLTPGTSKTPGPVVEVLPVDPNAKPVKKPRPAGLKEITNLLPGDAVSVWHLRMDELARTPFYASIFDRPTMNLFLTSMTFQASELDEILHCYTGPDKDAFAILRTKTAIDTDEMLKRLDLEDPKDNVINGRAFFLLKSNAFLTAIGKSLSLGSVFGIEGAAAKARQGKPADDRKLGISVYDSQTIVLADPLVMERFLNDLKADGLPPFKSELTPPVPIAPPTPMGGPMTPPNPMGGPMPMPMPPGGPMPMPMPPGGPMTPPNPMGGPKPPPPRKSFTSNPFFRTIDPELKKALNTLGDDDRETPGAVYVQKVDQRSLSDLDLRNLGSPDLADALLGNWFQQVKVMGFSITAMNRSKASAAGYFEYQTDDGAKKSVAEHILPAMTILKNLYAKRTRESVAVRDLTQSGQGGPMGPGGPLGPGGPMGTGDPGGPRPPFPGPMGPGNPPGGPGDPGGGPPSASHIDVGASDTVVSLQFEFEWQESTYQSVIAPGVERMSAQLKGRMSVLSGENDAFALAASLPKVVKIKGAFPPGALERDVRSERFGLPYSPEHRVSFFADLLPYLGKASLRPSIDEKKFAWYAEKNLPAAETWVPEFLVPYYDQTAWRATHEFADGRSLGATNYVGVAGLGLDAARYDPKDPATRKKLGMYGYDWASKPEDVTDGLSNTIAIIQVPPGHQRPWIAGGGATLAGIDDSGDKPLRGYVAKMPDGVRGTTALMGDGSVRTVRENIDPALFRAMVTRAGGDALDDFEKAAPKAKSAKKPNELTAVPPPVTDPKPPAPPPQPEEPKKP